MRILLVLPLLFALSLAALAEDWPQFLGASREGISPETKLNVNWETRAPAISWKVPMTDNGYAGPSVAAGKVFIIDHKGDQDIVRALDLATGEQVWQYSYADADKDNYGFSRATPTVNDGKVYTVSRLGQVYCLDAKLGTKIWSRNLLTEFNGKKPTWDYAMSALIDGDKVIVCPGGPNILAVLDKATGKTLLQGGGSDTPSYATPVVATLDGVKQYLVFAASGLLGVDAATGARLWSYPWKSSYDINAASPRVIGNTVFITSGYGHGCALLEVKGNTVSVRWESKLIQSHFSTPIIVDGYIYGTTDPGKLVCLDLQTGKLQWEHTGFEKGGLLGVDGTIIALAGNTGELIAAKLTPAGYTETGRIKPLGGQSWTAPILADGKLLIRNKTTLACLDMK